MTSQRKCTGRQLERHGPKALSQYRAKPNHHQGARLLQRRRLIVQQRLQRRLWQYVKSISRGKRSNQGDFKTRASLAEQKPRPAWKLPRHSRMQWPQLQAPELLLLLLLPCLLQSVASAVARFWLVRSSALSAGRSKNKKRRAFTPDVAHVPSATPLSRYVAADVEPLKLQEQGTKLGCT